MSDLKEHMEYIADHCDPLEVMTVSKGYAFIGDVGEVTLSASGGDIEIAAFEMMDTVRNHLHD